MMMLSPVSGHPTTKPFLLKGATSRTSMITAEPFEVAFSHYRAGGVMDHPREIRIHTSLLATVEKRCLVAIARRLPGWVGSDHLTALGAAGMLGAGLCYWAAPATPWTLFG